LRVAALSEIQKVLSAAVAPTRVRRDASAVAKAAPKKVATRAPVEGGEGAETDVREGGVYVRSEGN
jgi:hypothetical protein